MEVNWINGEHNGQWRSIDVHQRRGRDGFSIFKVCVCFFPHMRAWNLLLKKLPLPPSFQSPTFHVSPGMGALLTLSKLNRLLAKARGEMPAGTQTGQVQGREPSCLTNIQKTFLYQIRAQRRGWTCWPWETVAIVAAALVFWSQPALDGTAGLSSSLKLIGLCA